MFSNREHHLGNGAAMAPNGLAERYAINGHRVVLYAGTFEAYQGLDLLVNSAQEVIRKYNNVRFLCVGGTENQVTKMKAHVARQGVADYFIFPGTVPPEDLPSFFKLASVLVSPRISGTNTPLKIYSYLRSGVPIVATNILSHTQVLTNEVSLLVDPQPESFGRGVLRLLEDGGLGKRLAESAVQLAEKSYSAEAYYRKMAEVLSFLASKPRSST